MTPHRALNLFLATLIAAILSAAHLLDGGPSDIEATQATADSVQDAIQTAQHAAREARP